MYVRTKSEALDVVASVLGMPDRRQQIIQITVRIAMCLDPEARGFLMDCQSGLIEGGLEHMKKRRQELLAAQHQDTPEAIVIVDDSVDQLLEQAGMALDAMRLSEIVRQVFPKLREKFPAWHVARAFLVSEQEMRELTVQAVKAHGAGDGRTYDKAQNLIHRYLEGVTPSWKDAVSTISAACEELAPGNPDLLPVVATDDVRAQLVLSLLANSKAEAAEYLQGLLKRIETLRRLEAESK